MLGRKKKQAAVEKVELTTKEELKRARKREQRQALKKPSLWPIMVMILCMLLGGALWFSSIITGSREPVVVVEPLPEIDELPVSESSDQF